MNWTLILGILTVLFAFGWAAAYTAGKGAVKHAKDVIDKYVAAKADGNITDEERQAMLPDLIAFLEDASSLVQQVTNLVYKILPFFKKK